MAVTIEAVMQECRNFFETGYQEREYSIADGAITPNGLLAAGQYIAITGSLMNNGVYRVGDGITLEGAVNEEFFGRVWFLCPPKAFVELCAEIAKFDAKSPVTALKSETFGGYSYTLATGQNGAVLGWKEAFAGRLTPYRRMFKEMTL